MPSEGQLLRAEQELSDLQRELNHLEQAEDARKSAHRIMEFIENNHETLADPENPWYPQPCTCILL